jgi:hypothetical protein
MCHKGARLPAAARVADWHENALDWPLFGNFFQAIALYSTIISGDFRVTEG